MFEGSTECVALFVRNGEFHAGGSMHVHDFSDIGFLSVRELVSSPTYLPLQSLLEVGAPP